MCQCSMPNKTIYIGGRGRARIVCRHEDCLSSRFSFSLSLSGEKAAWCSIGEAHTRHSTRNRLNILFCCCPTFIAFHTLWREMVDCFFSFLSKEGWNVGDKRRFEEIVSVMPFQCHARLLRTRSTRDKQASKTHIPVSPDLPTNVLYLPLHVGLTSTIYMA